MFVFKGRDRADAGALRAETRQAHIEHLQSIGDAFVFGGPLLSDDEERMIGSLLVMDVADRAAAEAIIAADPYNKVGLFDTTSLERIKVTKR